MFNQQQIATVLKRFSSYVVVETGGKHFLLQQCKLSASDEVGAVDKKAVLLIVDTNFDTAVVFSDLKRDNFTDAWGYTNMEDLHTAQVICKVEQNEIALAIAINDYIAKL